MVLHIVMGCSSKTCNYPCTRIAFNSEQVIKSSIMDLSVYFDSMYLLIVDNPLVTAIKKGKQFKVNLIKIVTV